MRPYYKHFNGFKIDTQSIFEALWEFEEYFERSLLIEFRARLESTLFEKRLIEVKFYPIGWRYFRDYYLRWKNYNTKNDTASVFEPTFFVHDSRFSGEVKFEDLTDDEKIQIVVPPQSKNTNSQENYESLTLERRNEILDNWKIFRHTVDLNDNDNPYQFERWAYDIYSLYMPCEIEMIEEERDDFEFYFAWRLNLTDLFEIKPFLNWHLLNTFHSNWDNFREFCELLLLKYEVIISNPHIKAQVSQFLISSPPLQQIHPIANSEVNTTPLDTPTPLTTNGTEKVLGRKPSPKLEIPKPNSRQKDDKRTLLSRDDTVKLFNYLAQLNCVFNDSSEISKLSFAKGIEAFTGYSAGQLQDLLVYEQITPKNKMEKKDIAENIKKLIIKALSNTSGGT